MNNHSNSYKTHPKVLIVGTVPYSPKMQSRAFDAYFHYFEKENLAQIFSYEKTPTKGHCSTLFQITDYRILQRWKGAKIETGEIYNYESLPEYAESSDIKDESQYAAKAYRIGAKHSPLTHLLRGLLWRKKYWCTEKLNNWLDDFNPDCIFVCSSDDYFINKIALYVSRRYNIPIVTAISDDYIFNYHISLNPIYMLYKKTYIKLMEKIYRVPNSAIYISDKIRDKYNSEYGLNGETVYLTSTIKRKTFSIVNKEKPIITYFGNIRMGRNFSLNEIGYALAQINRNYILEVYSGEKDPSIYSVFDNNPNVVYGGSIPYKKVQEKMAQSDITVIVEGFKPKDIDWSRYSLSTKAADALASGATILTYGSQECGIVEYMQSTNASFVCTDKEKLVDTLEQLFERTDLQQQYYEQQIVVTRERHNINASCATVEKIINRTIESSKANLQMML